MKPPFSPPAHMGKRRNACDSFDSFLTLMRNLEIVIMNRADFCERQIVNHEEKASQFRSESSKLNSSCSSLVSLITQNSDKQEALAKVEPLVTNISTEIAGLIKEDLRQKQMKMRQEFVYGVIDRVYAAPLITSSPNPSRDLCSSFFTQFQLLERNIDLLDKFNCHMDLWLRRISTCQSKLREARLEFSSLINPPSTDHNKNETVGS